MKPFFVLIFFLIINSLQAQENYNLKKGFVAEGYDVVSYFSNEAIKGIDKYSTAFDGVNYKFSSAENLKTFKNNPEIYVPQYGGYCAYAVAIKGEKIDINPKSFQIIDDKLYLFYDSWGVDTLEKWNEEGSEKLQTQANTNWEEILKKKN